jgi:hypothetical protein
MGSLYLARDPMLDRLVAIKLLKDDFQDDEELRERFAREARSVARLRHPNIVIVHDVGVDEGRPFMAMEYIAGDTFVHVLRRKPPLSLAQRLALVEDLCAGLAHAHAAGIIHRDIKPANVMVDHDGVVKVLDFGIARLTNSGMTQDGMMLGSVNYMSPEQVVGRGVDHRTDIFATGAVLYEVIALQQAFPGGVDSGVLHRILNAGPEPLETRVPDIDPELAGIVRHALEREPGQRYQDVSVMRRDLARIRRRLVEEGSESPTTTPLDATAIARPKTSPPPAARQGDSDRPKRLDQQRFAELRRQQREEHLRQSEDAFAKGDHEAALHCAERAAAVDPDSHTAYDLIDRARFAIAAKAVRHHLGEADRLLAEGRVDEAIAMVEQASAAVLDVGDAAQLREEVRRVSGDIAAFREREERIATSLERARTSLQREGYETALRAVYEVLALDPDRAEARELEKLAQSRLHARREYEQARRVAYERLELARTLAWENRFDEAVRVIELLTPPSDTVRLAAKDALAAVRAGARRAAHAAAIAQARADVEQQHFERALAAIDAIPEDDRTDEAQAVRASAVEGLAQEREREQKRRALEDALASVGEAIEQADLTKARERLDEAARIGLDDGRIRALRQRIADLAVAAQERRRQEARDWLAAKTVEAARRLLAKGDGPAAIEMLEGDTSGHALVESALREVRAVVAEEEERARREAERLRREQEARREADLEAARRKEEARKAAEARLQEERRQQEEARQRELEKERERIEREQREAREREEQAWREQEEQARREREEQARHEREEQARREREEQARRERERQAQLAREAEAATLLVRKAPPETPTPASPAEPTIARPPAPVRRRKSSLSVGVAAGAVLAIAAGIVLLRDGDDDRPTAPIQAPASNPPGRSLPPAAGGAAIGTPEAESGPGPRVATTPRPPAAVPDSPDANAGLEQKLQGQRVRARELLARGQVRQALAAVQTALQLKADDREARAILDSIARDATSSMERAKTEASDAGAPAAAADAYRSAARLESQAERERRAGRLDRAVPLLWNARDGYNTAATEATRAATASNSRPDPPPQESPRVTPSQPAPEPPATRTETAPRQAPAPADQPPARIDERAAIAQTIRAYEAAWASLDADALRRVQEFSAAEMATVRRSLDAAREFRVVVQIQDVRIEPDGRRASVTAQVRRTFIPKSAARPSDISGTNVFTMEKRGDAWVIVDLR